MKIRGDAIRIYSKDQYEIGSHESPERQILVCGTRRKAANSFKRSNNIDKVLFRLSQLMAQIIDPIDWSAKMADKIQLVEAQSKTRLQHDIATMLALGIRELGR